MKVLIIRFSSIGDIVLTSPLIRCVKHQLGAEIHYLTKEAYRGILLGNPHISRVIALDRHIHDVIPDLRAAHYDLIVNLHKNIRSWQVCTRLGVRSVSYDKANIPKWLLVNLKINVMPEAHIVHRYFQALSTLDIAYDGKGLDYYLPKETVSPVINKEESFMVFAIGGAHHTKKLPCEKIRAICELVAHKVYLVGGPDDREAGEQIAHKLDHVDNLAGKCTLAQSALVIKEAKLVVTHDTGMMHIAAAFSRPIISIWGNTVPSFGMTPFYPDGTNTGQTLFEVNDLSCRPCSKIGHKECPKSHFRCMLDQPVETIAHRASTMMSA